MKEKFDFLIIEDVVGDLDLEVRILTKSGILNEFHHVETEKDFRQVLQTKTFDVILADYRLPQFDAPTALEILKETGLDIPFIVVTGTVGEEVVVELMKKGAHDYLLKDNLTRLPEVIRREVNDAHNRLKGKQAEDSLHESEERFKTLFEHSPDGIVIYTDGIIEYANPAALELIKAKTFEEVVGKPVINFVHPDYHEIEKKRTIKAIISGNKQPVIEVKYVQLDGNIIDVEVSGMPVILGDKTAIQIIVRDITQRKFNQEKMQLLAHMVASIGECVSITDTEDRIIFVNPAFAKTYGYTEEELVGKSIEIVRSPKNPLEVTEKILTETLAGGWEGEILQLRKDGSEFPIALSTSVIRDIHTVPVALVGVATDITKAKKTEAELLKLSIAVEQSPASIVITDLEGNIEYVNSMFSKITGYTFDEVKGKNPRIIKSGTHSEEYYKNMWETILSGNTWKSEIQNKKKNGELFWENALISPVFNKEGKITNFITVKEDITEKKILITDLIKAKEKAEESDRLKSAFLANMSHEIRTPMNGILGFASLLKEPNLAGPEQQKYIEIIEKSSNRMLNIINDIVNISKIEAGLIEIHLEDLNVNEQIEYFYAFFKPEVEAKKIKFSYKNTLILNESIIRTDHDKFLSILSNIIKNAIKYTEKGSIEFGCVKKGEYLEFYVKDTGIGVAKERQEAIFERFIQADIEDKMARQGAGLGLSIAKAYIEILGGELWLESEKGIGSVFYFTIPCNGPSNQINKISKQATNKNIENQIKKLNILIAEDDETSCLLINTMVEKIKGEIIYANNGVEAVELCQSNPQIDLILMDIKMPGMDGYEATRQIRQFNKDVIIVALTAYALQGDYEKAIESGCNKHLSKPIIWNDFYSILKQFFAK